MLQPIDVIDEDNHLTGEKSNPEDANNRGLWHRGAHVILFTNAGNVLVQKRSPNAIQYPNMLEISVSGFVDSGETPQQAAIREVYEEAGLQLSSNDLIFLGTIRYNHQWHWKNKHKTTRTIIYNYVARVDEAQAILPDHTEVAWAKFLPLHSARWLTYHGSLKHLGKLLPRYAYYRKTLKQASKFMSAE